MIIDEADVVKRVDEYFFSSKLRELANLKQKGYPIINLGVGSPDLPPHQEVVAEMKEQLIMNNSHGYQTYKGNSNFLIALQTWYKQYFNVNLNSESNFLPLNGSKEGISFILHSFINPGDSVLVPNPGYPTYKAASLLNYANVDYYELKAENNFYPDFDALEAQIKSNTKIIFLNYANMPTGVPATKKVFSEFVRIAKKHNVLLVNDNPYVFLHHEQLSIFSVEGALEVAIELNSLSKSHNLAGWRIGMAVANVDYINVLLKMRSNVNSGHFLPIQEAAVKALNLPKEWYVKQQNIYFRRRAIFEQVLSDLGCEFVPNQGGMFVWAKVPDGFTSGSEFSDFLLYEGNVFVTPGIIFGSQGEKYFRISLSISDSELKEAANRIVSVMTKKVVL